MQTANKGHLVFLSLVNSYRDYKHQQFVEGLFQAILPEGEASSEPQTGVYVSNVCIHQKLVNEGTTLRSSVLGSVTAKAAADYVISGVRKNENYISMPSLMTFAVRCLNFLPNSISERILNLIYV